MLCCAGISAAQAQVTADVVATDLFFGRFALKGNTPAGRTITIDPSDGTVTEDSEFIFYSGPMDLPRRGEYEVSIGGLVPGNQYQIEFITNVNSPVDLTTAGSPAFTVTGITTDPATPLIMTANGSGTAEVTFYVGGTLRTTGAHHSGTYSSPVSMSLLLIP